MIQATNRKPFAAHLEELQSRLMWSVIFLVIFSTIGYTIKDHLLKVIVSPLGLPLYYTSPGGGFNLIIQLCLGFGIAASVPIFIYHIIKFIAPVIPNYRLSLLIKLLLASTTLVIAGLSFAYFVSLPAALYFLSEFSTSQVQALISIETYISFISIYLAGFALLFQLPLLLLLVNRLTPLRPSMLIAKIRWVILGTFIIAAILTPTPDPINQAIMAGPMIGLYGLSIGMIGVVNRKKGVRYDLRTVEEVLLDLSNKRLASKVSSTRDGRCGHICLWEEKGARRGTGRVVTFLYKGKHELIAKSEARTDSEISSISMIDGWRIVECMHYTKE